VIFDVTVNLLNFDERKREESIRKVETKLFIYFEQNSAKAVDAILKRIEPT
jgi:hypothetical protein